MRCALFYFFPLSLSITTKLCCHASSGPFFHSCLISPVRALVCQEWAFPEGAKVGRHAIWSVSTHAQLTLIPKQISSAQQQWLTFWRSGHSARSSPTSTCPSLPCSASSSSSRSAWTSSPTSTWSRGTGRRRRGSPQSSMISTKGTVSDPSVFETHAGGFRSAQEKMICLSTSLHTLHAGVCVCVSVYKSVMPLNHTELSKETLFTTGHVGRVHDYTIFQAAVIGHFKRSGLRWK